MKTLKQIQNENREAIIMACNPECKNYDWALEKEADKKGCFLRFDTWNPSEVYETISEPFQGSMRVIDKSGNDYSYCPSRITEIIGKPLTLNRVLLALQPIDRESKICEGMVYVNRWKQGFLGIGYNPIKEGSIGDLIEIGWDLTKETLEEQTEECQRAINALLGNE